MNHKDTDSLAHTTWECKYHVVFAPKYRRQIIYKDIRRDVGSILRKLENCINLPKEGRVSARPGINPCLVSRVLCRALSRRPV
jgi:hypothetical protein